FRPFSTHTRSPLTTTPFSLHDALPIYHDAVREQHGLIDIVRDHHHRSTGLGHHAVQLVLQGGTCQRIQSAKRFIHQQYLWLHREDRKSTRLNSSHEWISYAVFCLKKKK